MGNSALGGATSGSNNTALGQNAGNGIGTGSYNVEIGNFGASGDSNLILTGTQGTQTKTAIAGIYGVTITGGSTVVVNSSGQLGVQSSSIRYKEDVHDMGDASAGLSDLSPVTFRYRQPAEAGNKPLQYGLIGEEVEKI